LGSWVSEDVHFFFLLKDQGLINHYFKKTYFLVIVICFYIFKGSAAIDLAFVAAGSADVNFHFGGLHCWDVVAGALLVNYGFFQFQVMLKTLDEVTIY